MELSADRLCPFEAERRHKLHGQREGSPDVLPLALESVHIGSIEIVHLETDTANVAQHQAGL